MEAAHQIALITAAAFFLVGATYWLTRYRVLPSVEKAILYSLACIGLGLAMVASYRYSVTGDLSAAMLRGASLEELLYAAVGGSFLLLVAALYGWASLLKR